MNKLKNKFISVVKYFILLFLKLYFSTITIKKINPIPSDDKALFCFYHQNIIMLLMLLRVTSYYQKMKKVSFLSAHKDADILAFFLEKNKFTIIRTDRLHFSPGIFRNFIKAVKKNHNPIISVDGPIGPNKKINNGPIFLAEKFQLPLKVILIKAKSYWQLSSWDQHIIPKPFTTVWVKHTNAFNLKKSQREKPLENFKDFIHLEEQKFLKQVS